MKRCRFGEGQNIRILKKHRTALYAAVLWRQHGVNEPTFCKGRSKHGGLDVSNTKGLKALKEETAKLKKLLAASMLDISTLREMLGRNF